jgi:hypothetical protein
VKPKAEVEAASLQQESEVVKDGSTSEGQEVEASGQPQSKKSRTSTE